MKVVISGPETERWRPDSAAAIRDQRDAIEELGAALRLLVQQSVGTEAGPDDLRLAAAQVRAAAVPLGRHQRQRAQLPAADDLLTGIRLYNPVCGTGSALAPPLHVEVVGATVVGTCTLGLAFEGPPMYAHGGISALLMDQMLGQAISSGGHPGMTVNLVTQYRGPVPLQTPLRLTAEIAEIDGRRVTAKGIIATAAEPDTTLDEATGVFVTLRPDQARRLFETLVGLDAADPSVAHD
jgi:acyl-CoA thioesterase FadM